MKPTPFCEDTDLAPIPFDLEHCLLAKRLKLFGLRWRPHAGCFVWDEAGIIEVQSPFPNRIYFVLNLGHFLRRFSSLENMVEGLVWLPTWHQARLLCQEMGIGNTEILDALSAEADLTPGQDLAVLYHLILGALGA